MSVVRFYAWGAITPSNPKEYQDLRREIRKELQQNNMWLMSLFAQGRYRLIRKVRNVNAPRKRKVICDGDMLKCCRRAAEIMDGVTFGGNTDTDIVT